MGIPRIFNLLHIAVVQYVIMMVLLSNQNDPAVQTASLKYFHMSNLLRPWAVKSLFWVVSPKLNNH